MNELHLLSVKEAAELLGISKRAVHKQITQNKLKATTVKSNKGGRGGVEYLIPFSALPIQVQKKAVKLFKEVVK